MENSLGKLMNLEIHTPFTFNDINIYAVLGKDGINVTYKMIHRVDKNNVENALEKYKIMYPEGCNHPYGKTFNTDGNREVFDFLPF